MNDDDLERRLRSESGPRERGYLPAQLPASLEAKRPVRRSRLIRVAVLVSAVVAGIGVVAVATALLSNTGPRGTLSGSSPSPPVGLSVPEYASCRPPDVAFSAEPWGGAAGSRGTVVTFSLGEGRYPCLFGPVTAGRIEGPTGEALIEGPSRGLDGIYVLTPGTEASLAVSWSNWCGEPADSVQLVLVSAGIDLPVDVPVGIGAIPPCNGENAPSELSISTALTDAP